MDGTMLLESLWNGLDGFRPMAYNCIANKNHDGTWWNHIMTITWHDIPWHITIPDHCKHQHSSFGFASDFGFVGSVGSRLVHHQALRRWLEVAAPKGGHPGWKKQLKIFKKKWEAKSKRNGYPFSRFSSAASLDCTPALVKTVRHGKVLIHSWPEKRQTEARGCLITEIYQYSSCLGLRFGGVIYILRVLSSEVLHMGPGKKPCRSL